ncbi:sigma factor-like helix-turn-helix DNA-binding protein [Streptomyces wuyuanensis]|uniref:sigma factor-like helix-turn-helix DNA-binding protein n=1 Tax=Streptomyces wuyuanensis TaxID=1196353 RepID=UPI0034359386
MDHDDHAVPLAELLDERRQLLDVAHWMLGSSAEAESVVDEAYRRWYGLSGPARARIAGPRAWLVRVTGGICLDRLAVPGRGPVGAPGVRPGTEAVPPDAVLEEVDEVLLGALDSLSPEERAAFVLNDVFGMAPGAVAGIVGQPEQECAELVHRARRSLRARRLQPTPPRQHDLVVRAVRQACLTRDATLLTSLLARNVTAYFDGGGKVRALDTPVRGSLQVAHSLLTLLAGCPNTALQARSVNGRTGLVVRYDHEVAAVICLDIAGRQVVQVWTILNPDKLRSWNRRGDASSSPPGG